MSTTDTKTWDSDWELTGSPLHQANLKPEPLWSYHASIETIKKSPSKLSQDQSIDASRFFTLEKTVRGSLFSSNDDNGALYRGNVGGDDHSIPAHITSTSKTSLAFSSSSILLPVSPTPSQAHKRDWNNDGKVMSAADSLLTDEMIKTVPQAEKMMGWSSGNQKCNGNYDDGFGPVCALVDYKNERMFEDEFRRFSSGRNKRRDEFDKCIQLGERCTG